MLIMIRKQYDKLINTHQSLGVFDSYYRMVID